MNKSTEWSLRLKKWALEYNFRLILFNIILVFLFLLRSAGYFQPYFPISVNFIVIVGLVLSVVLLNLKSREIFLVVIVFWVFAGFLRVMRIDVWAERTGIYAYESLLFAVILFLLESISKSERLVNKIYKFYIFINIYFSCFITCFNNLSFFCTV
jgi:hypothetical protein